MQIKKTIITKYMIISFFLIFTSCSFGTAIYVANNANLPLHIECKTIFDDQIYRTRHYNRGIIGFVKIDERRDLQIPVNSFLLNEKGLDAILFVLNRSDVLQLLGYGTIKSLDDSVYAINEIFIEINVYKYENEEKILLYDKNYFLNKSHFEIGKRYAKITIS